MNLSGIRVMRRWNVAQYEHLELDLTFASEDGEDADTAVNGAIEFIESKRPVYGAPVKSGKPAGKPAAKPAASTAPPLAGKGKTSSDPTSPTTATTNTGAAASNTTQSGDPPFEPGSKVAAKPQKPRKRGRPKNPNKEPAKLLKGLESILTIQEVANRFEAMRVLADRTPGEGWDSWEKIWRQVAEHAKSIPDCKTQSGYEQLDLAMKAEIQAGKVAEASVA